ncbi:MULTISPECIES: FxSxx-COOH cyclophane-containing RiPP peptide [Nocardiopsis]|uniref:FxSxx-COOH cyclophane-containing RiPP peptide n=1 Tax=Nocardiopsis TaxID=2013 RepID=UPI00034BFB19|nr:MULTISPECIES: FxSxx-COOH cyclophane-containing RiPP peptide [Nocardiopsis]MBQ1080848.1 FXSXX-COOH protein [Nocardiopsis sp. B62]PWV44490.1 FXSXX-COOH protein [Nocardiopsis sp. L17-MgMaSL7]
MGEHGSTGGTALVDVGELSLRDLEAMGGSAIAEALRTVLDPGEAGAEVVAGFVNDPE